MNFFPWKSLSLNKYKTTDNAIICYHYQNAKKYNNRTIIITLAWNMSPDVFSPLLLTNKKIIDYHDVYIFIIRGYKTNITYGNNIDRCALDLFEFIKQHEIENFIAMGHSIGNALWYEYFMLFGQKNIYKFILIDEMTCILQNPLNTNLQNTEYGAIIPLKQLFISYNILKLNNDYAIKYRINQIKPQFSDNFKVEYPDIMNKIYKKVNLYSLNSSADFLYSNNTNNWIDKILNKKINIPTLLLGGEKSVVPFQSIIYQKKYFIKHKVYIFKGSNSSHFAFMENYKLFNKILDSFLFSES